MLLGGGALSLELLGERSRALLLDAHALARGFDANALFDHSGAGGVEFGQQGIPG